MREIRHEGYFFDEDEETVRRKKIRRRKRKRVLMTIGGIIAAIAAFILVFHTRKINVSGNEYCTAKEVKAWIQQDPLSYNSLYVWWRYNHTDAEQLPLVEAMDIQLKSPWEIDARVYEKSIVGYLDFDGTHVYLDKDGVVISQTAETMEGIPCIEGIQVELSKIVLHEKLPVKKSDAFESVFEISQALEQGGLTAERISISEDGDATIYMGIVAAALGTGDYADKVAQLPPIMEKLQENYPDQAGILHLEEYSKTHTSIRFTPE